MQYAGHMITYLLVDRSVTIAIQQDETLNVVHCKARPGEARRLTDTARDLLEFLRDRHSVNL